MLNGFDMLSGLQLEEAVVANAVNKAQNSLDKTFFLGILAGFWIGMGGIAGLSTGGGIPATVRAAWPILPRLGVAAIFPFGLVCIVLFGGELFTGNTMLLALGWLNRKVTLKRMLLNWVVVYIGNFCGCLLTAYLFGYLTNSFANEPWRSYVMGIAEVKTHYGWGVLLLRGIPANTLVCLAVVIGLATRDGAGKIMGIYFPVLLFLLSAFEHSVANMFFVNIGLMYGAKSSIVRMLYNQSAVALGNLIGGAIVLAATQHVLNHWRSPIPWGKGHPRATPMGHDVESIRHVKDQEVAAESTAVSSSPSLSRHPRLHHDASDENMKSHREPDTVQVQLPHFAHSSV